MARDEDSGPAADASELILCPSDSIICDTFIYEPSQGETELGNLYVTGEVSNEGDIGRDLLELTVQALQKEYYRDPSRGVLVSFESALHQANLILHDTAEAGVRSWMEHFHMAVAVLSRTELHISTAGAGHVYLARGAKANHLSQDLSRSPITNPLRTFAQVASGTVRGTDTLYLGTAALGHRFRLEDFTRFAIERQPDTITTRLKQLYEDQRADEPLAAQVITLRPTYQASSKPTTPPQVSPRDKALPSLNPRQPLVIKRSFIQSVMAIVTRLASSSWRWFKQTVWPLLVKGGRRSGRVVVAASAQAQRQASKAAASGMQRFKRPAEGGDNATEGPAVPSLSPIQVATQGGRGGVAAAGQLGSRLSSFVRQLPTSSKFFAILSLVLVVTLIASLIFLQRKRAADTVIQEASENLYGAQTKLQAAENALIYDNRDRSRELLEEARADVAVLAEGGLYQTEASELSAKLQALEDRLARVVRIGGESTRVVGDFGEVLPDSTPLSLSLIGDNLYTFDPATNNIAVLPLSGGQASLVSDQTEGVGFFASARSHSADKSIVFATANAELALFDSKDNSVRKQEVILPSAESSIASFALYGSRLYLYDPATSQIYGYSKDLTGYAGAAAWISDDAFPRDSIKDLAVDGSIYTLHENGSVNELFRGEQVEFVVEEVAPDLSGATRVITNEELRNLYVFDPREQRVVIFSKESGSLVRQVSFADEDAVTDFVVSPEESSLHVLAGTRVFTVDLSGE